MKYLLALLLTACTAAAAAYTNVVALSAKDTVTAMHDTNTVVIITNGTVRQITRLNLLKDSTITNLTMRGTVYLYGTPGAASATDKLVFSVDPDQNLLISTNTLSDLALLSAASNTFAGPIYGTLRLSDGTAALSVTNTFYATDVNTNRTTNVLVYLNGLLKSWTITP